MVPVRNGTLMRTVRRPRKSTQRTAYSDWHRRLRLAVKLSYGTNICALERRRPVTLLPARELATSQAWLARHQSIRVIARDRSGGYGEAAAKALARMPFKSQIARI